MSDYLTRLSLRALGRAEAVRPALRPLFAPEVAGPDPSPIEPTADRRERSEPRTERPEAVAAADRDVRGRELRATRAPRDREPAQSSAPRPPREQEMPHETPAPPSREAPATAPRLVATREPRSATREAQGPERIGPSTPIAGESSQSNDASRLSPAAHAVGRDVPARPVPASVPEQRSRIEPNAERPTAEPFGPEARLLLERLRAADRPSARAQDNAPSTVRIHIGRVEVRAAPSPPTLESRPVEAPPPAPASRGVELSDYLTRRHRGKSGGTS